MENKRTEINLKRFERNIENFYPHRTAVIDNIFIEIKDEDLWKKVKTFLEQNGQHLDNHICWTLDNGIHGMWSDSRLMYGTEIVLKNW